jgi:hypothetical protein
MMAGHCRFVTGPSVKDGDKLSSDYVSLSRGRNEDRRGRNLGVVVYIGGG